MEKQCLVVGCGLTGSVVARHLAEQGYQVQVWERRNHIGGNMYDYRDEHGILIQAYGPHAFHTKETELYNYVCQYEQWQEFHLTCGAVINEKFTQSPFNFSTVDDFYPHEHAERIKEKLKMAFPGRSTASVLEVLEHPDTDIREYAEFLFHNDYAPYTAKQWGITPDQIDCSVLKRVPLRFSYQNGYFDDPYQIMPVHSFSAFFQNLLSHNNISVALGVEALEHLAVKDRVLYLDGSIIEFPVIYTGALDELFGCIYGRLPYRSLRFEYDFSEIESFQPAPVVAYPQAADYTRITEFKKLPHQNVSGTSYVLEYPQVYTGEKGQEPYYPVLTDESLRQYKRYRLLADDVSNLIPCGRLADFKYYNMDQALGRALDVCRKYFSENYAGKEGR